MITYSNEWGWLLLVLSCFSIFCLWNKRMFDQEDLYIYWNRRHKVPRPYLLIPLKTAARKAIEEHVKLEDKGYPEYSTIHILNSSTIVNKDLRPGHLAERIIQGADVYGKRPDTETLQLIERDRRHISPDGNTLLDFNGQKEVAFNDLMIKYKDFNKYIKSLQPKIKKK